ncbi:MAG: ABC transporter permease [Candidatus Helarchaeota archaeon]
MQNNLEITSVSGTRKLLLVAKYEWLKHFRKRRLYITIILATFILLILNFLLPYLMSGRIESFEFPPTEAIDFFTGSFSPLGGIWFVVVFIAIFFGSDSMSAEFENSTGLLLFPNPVKRGTIVFGKFFASILMATIVLAFYYVLTWILGICLYSGLVWELGLAFLGSFGMALLITTGLIATTFMLSAIFNKSLVTSIIVFVVFLIVMNMVSMIFNMAVSEGDLGFEPWYLINYNANLIPWVMNYPADRIIEIVGPMGTTYQVIPDILTGILTTVIGYIVIPLSISTIIYNKREI